MKRNLVKAMSFLVLLLASWGCNDNFDRLLSDEDYEDAANVDVKAQKVLFLVVDGARGTSVRDLKPANISALTKNATYSWTSLSDNLYNDASTWADMFTGVSKEKHRVLTSNFDNNKLYLYPTVLKRVKIARPSTRIASFSASSAFKEHLTEGADVSEAYSNDAEVKGAIINELMVDSASVVVGLFKDVDKAGASSGYDLSFPSYRNALVNFDNQLGEILTALRARRNYSKENWLIIVTSGRGGTYALPANESDGTVFSDTRINTFTIFANDNYKIKFVDKPFTGTRYESNFVRLNNSNSNAIRAQIDSVVPNIDLFNFATDVEFTIELKVKKLNRGTNTSPNYDYANPVILAKKASKLSRTGIGWALSLETKTWQMNFGNATLNNFTVQAKANSINDGNWHTLSVVVYNKTVNNVAGRYVRIFTDGIYDKEALLPANWGPLDIPYNPVNPTASYNPLTIGFIPGETTNPFNGYISDIRIWRSALTDATISSYACDTYITSNHPNYKSLAGYWPCTDGSGGLFKDQSVVKNHFTIKKGDEPLADLAQWEANSSLVCPVSSTTLGSMVPNTKDIASQFLSWLAIPAVESWKLEGRVWLNQ